MLLVTKDKGLFLQKKDGFFSGDKTLWLLLVFLVRSHRGIDEPCKGLSGNFGGMTSVNIHVYTKQVLLMNVMLDPHSMHQN